jgi:hypothetical protein
MGEAIHGRMLNRAELAKARERIKEKYRTSMIERFAEIPPLANNGTLNIISGGVEIETHIVKLLDELEREFPPGEISPEFTMYTVERATQTDQLFTLKTPLDDMVGHFNELLNPVRTEAAKHNAGVLLLGGHPGFSADQARTMLTPRERYSGLVTHLAHHARGFSIPFVNETVEKVPDFFWGGIGASVQLTIKTPTWAVPSYYEADRDLGAIFLALSSSSPMVEGRATKWNSARENINPSATYGLPNDDRRPGRWGPLSFGELSEYADRKLFEGLVEQNLPLQVAQYFAEVAGYGHLLVSKKDVDGDAAFIRDPQRWPYTKIHANAGVTDNYGMGIESRAGEMMPTARENAYMTLCKMAALQARAEQRSSNMRPALTGVQEAYNIKEAANNIPLPLKKMYWATTSGIEKLPLHAIMRQIIDPAAKALQESGHPTNDVEEILGQMGNMAGVQYHKGRVDIINQRLLTPAERLLTHAYAVQPNIADGKPINPNNMMEIIGPSLYRQE